MKCKGVIVVIGVLIVLCCPACNPIRDSATKPEILPTLTRTPGNTQAAQESQLLSIDQLRERWLSGVPCAPPCWEGIVPGQTSAEEAIEILSSTPMFTNVEYLYISMYDQVSFQVLFLDEQGNVDSLSGRLNCDHLPGEQVIRVITVQIPPTPLGMIISSYGAPSHAATLEEIRVEPPDWSVYVVWEMLGLQMWTWSLDVSQGIGESLLLDEVDYFVPGIDAYRDAFGQGSVDILSPWRGYAGLADYQYVIPFIFPEDVTPTP